MDVNDKFLAADAIDQVGFQLIADQLVAMLDHPIPFHVPQHIIDAFKPCNIAINNAYHMHWRLFTIFYQRVTVL